MFLSSNTKYNQWIASNPFQIESKNWITLFSGGPEFQNHCHCCGRDIYNLIFKCDEKRKNKPLKIFAIQFTIGICICLEAHDGKVHNGAL